MQWYLAVLKNYVGFSGRARRKEFWMFVLFHLIVLVILSILDNLLGTAPEGGDSGGGLTSSPWLFSAGVSTGLLGGLYMLAVFLPGLAVTIRRLHDTNRRGWWILILLVPLVGWLIHLIFMLLPGQQEENRFGADPKASGEVPPPAGGARA